MSYGSSSFGSESYGGSSNVTLSGTITFTIDVKLLKESVTKTFSIDSRLVLRKEITFSIDCILVKRKEVTFTTDSFLRKTVNKTFTVDSKILKQGVTKTFSIDSRLVLRKEKTISIDAALQKTYTKTFSIGGRTYPLLFWLNPWKFRKKITVISNDARKVQVNQVIQITVYKSSGVDTATDVFCNNHVNNDFSDIRFTDANGLRLINYKRVSYVSGTSATILIEIPYVPLLDVHNIYIYYGNTSATDASTSSLALSESYVVKTINLNNAVPRTQDMNSCSPFLYQTFTDTIPSGIDEAWVAQKGLSTYTQITNNTNGIFADDIWGLQINGITEFIDLATGVPECPLFPSTYIGNNRSVNISNTILSLIGTTVDFFVMLVNSIPSFKSATSGAVYLIYTYVTPTLLFGYQESRPRVRIFSHKVGLRII